MNAETIIPRPVFVSAEVAAKVFDWPSAILAMQAIYARPLAASAVPMRQIARDDGAWLRTLPALPPGSRYFGAKLMAEAPAAAHPGGQFVTVLYDRVESAIAAFLDASPLTGYRTAATSAAALDKLAPAGPMRLGVLGSGYEAAKHIAAFATIRELADVAIYSTTPARREALAKAVSAEHGVPARAVATPEQAAAGATVLLAAARSHGEKPTVYGDWIEPGTVVVSIGSTIPSQREVDVSVVDRCDLIVCDMVEEVVEHTGDMIEVRKAGQDFGGKMASLNALMRGELDERVRAATAPMFKSVGGGLQDVAVAEIILERALAAGLAEPMNIAFETRRRG